LQFYDQITPPIWQKLCAQTHLKWHNRVIWHLFIDCTRSKADEKKRAFDAVEARFLDAIGSVARSLLTSGW
jgi:hypothetical protein